ncbi:mitochondrial translation protein [Penicillium cosmopolitanum]|uniref:Mitochondrial translation protein n=1 Tax=Penicillium cosmopolitanum TaxID=1131564 RepID=A0A9W9W2J1_9EURO|nr:mitochondrial translation protein [Penicillium cosmopolitanum]KAJ5397342.1 mitochondrial translation protein [Penicillium cosmopolitanum]
MLRLSTRSVPGPTRSHVCFSCLAVQSSAQAKFRQLHTTPPTLSKHKTAKTSKQWKKNFEDPDAKSNHRKYERKGNSKRSESGGDKATRKQDADGETTEQNRLDPVQASNDQVLTAFDIPEPEKPSSSMNPEARARKETAGEDRALLKHVAKNIENKYTGSINSTGQQVKPLDVPTAPVPGLSFGLDRVLFNPGVYHLRDPRSRVYNFDPYLGSIMPVTEFDFNTLKDYITSSKDETLREVAVKANKKYIGSSSSMTSVLSHFHFLLSGWREIDVRTVSQGFPEKMRSFTRLLRSPAAMFLHYQDGTYAIDADKEFDSANILMNLGKSMEKLLTLPKEEFERYRRSHENKISAEEEESIPEAYHYSTYGDFVMRSQLDAYDPRLPGTGMFDLKTRAVVSIRMDAKNFEQGLGYEIKDRYGAFESYEREFYDMIRAAFLKYSLQVRIGRMDGIFVAFHNIERIFGFQYVSLPEMDQALHGQSDTALGDTEFQLSLGMWNEVLNKATEKFPKQSLRFHFDSRDTVTPFMYIFVEPVTQDEIHAIQNKNKDEIEEYQNRLLNLIPKEEDFPLEPGFRAPESEVVEESQQSEESEAETAPGVYDSSLPPDETFNAEQTEALEPKGPLLAYCLTAKNLVNGKPVKRPENFSSADLWTVDWELSELNDKQGRHLYNMCQTRRQKALAGRGDEELNDHNKFYLRNLQKLARQGRKYRAQENKRDKEEGIVVLDGEV